MTSVTPPLNPGDNTDAVTNLKAALILLITRQIIVLGTDVAADWPTLINNEIGYGDITKRAVTAFQQSRQIQATGTVDEATAKELNAILNQLGAINNVTGYIYMDYGIPANNIKLRLYSRNFGGNDTVVAEASTDEQGKYNLSYNAAGISSGNFEVRAVDAAGKETSLSDTLFNSEGVSDLNLIVPAAVSPVTQSEFTRLSTDVSGVIGDIGKLTDAQEKDDRQDLTMLSQATNWDARTIALASLAVKLSQDTSLSQEAAYALVRSGLPSDADHLAQVNADDVQKALDTATTAGIINFNDDQKKAAVTSFQTFADKTRLSTKDFSSLSTYSDLLTNQDLTADEQQIFASAYFSPRKNAAELWQKAKDAGLADDKIKGLQLQGKLGMLTVNNAPLAKDLQANVSDLSNLVDAGLYEPDAWDTKLKTLAGTQDDNAEALDKLIPPAYIGGTIADRKQAYITDMAAKVSAAFPEKVVRDQIDKGKLVLGDAATQTNISSFLSKAEGLGYKLSGTHIDTFAGTNDAALFAGISSADKSKAIEGVKTLSRVHQVTPNDQSMQVLLDLGHVSAQDIVAVPKDDFVNRFAKAYSDKYKITLDEGIRIGKLIYNKSQQVTTVTYNFFTSAKTAQQAPPVFAVSGDPVRQAQDMSSLDSKITGAPNLQELFGSLDYCECEHCRSVLSPAAYLVDLLQFLDRKDTDWQYFLDKWKTDHAGDDYTAKYAKPYDALIDRRPDIVNLPLTCENTNTALPYIDIVNEILEYYLVNNKLSVDAVHDTGNATTAELLAEPQYVEPKAYGILKSSKYPLGLPFDLWIETVRQFCDQYDTPLWQLIKIMHPVNGIDFETQNKIAVESLGISPDEYTIFTNEDSLTNLFNLYGYSSNAEMATGLKSAKQLADKLGVSYVNLLSLMQTQFINPNLSKLVLLQKMQVSVNDVFRYNGATGFTPFTADEKQAFDDKLALIKTLYGTDAAAEIKTLWDAGVFKQFLLLNDTNAVCNFDATIVGYANKDASTFDWLKFNLLVRLWKKLGWKIEEVDQALFVLLPANLRSIIHDPAKADADRAKALAAGLASALLNIAHLNELALQVNIGSQALIKLTTFWADIPGITSNSLYSQLFLSQNVLKIDPVFDDALGNYLTKDVKIKDPQKDHSIVIQAALNLSANDIAQIFKDNALDLTAAKLTMANISLVYRYVVLAKVLQCSVTDLIALKQLSGLNPFAPLTADALQKNEDDILSDQTLKFVKWATQARNSGFKLEDINFLFRHQFDPTGKYRNVQSDAAAAIKSISNEIKRIKTDHAVPVNPANAADLSPFAAFTDDVLQQNLSLVIQLDKVQSFLGMWTGKIANNWSAVSDSFTGILDQPKFNSLFVPDAANATDVVKQKNLLTKRATLAKALLPFIQRKLITQSIYKILASSTSGDTVLIQWLINSPAHLNNPAQATAALFGTFFLSDNAANVAAAQSAYILLNKVIQLGSGLQLSTKEMQYFILNIADFNNLNLSTIPFKANNPLPDAQALFKAFMRLCDYVNLRQDLTGGSDDLIDIFSKARHSYPAGSNSATTQTTHLNALYQLVANLTRRDLSVVSAVAKALGIQATSATVNGLLVVTAAAFVNEQGITALWNTLKLVQTFGIPVESLTEASKIITTGLPDEEYQAIAENFKNAVKARYDLDAWQQIAQPIFDKLRQKRRDALVASLLHNFSDLFSSTEEMYEYFLIDPGTEPVVQTSRIRIATASVQLFIQRCLLNLENRWDKKVPPAAINSKFWQWMNRYRVWEANRKIFLWPENWLEPEWRDDKTYLFKELEAKLLQGDVSNDLVEDAFYVYLKKFEEISRLDIVAMYCDEDPVTPESNTLHVLGRTFGFPHKYFYRTYAQEMWTPWEVVDAQIDGDHIVVVMWRGRLHILWVTFIEKMDTTGGPSAGSSSATKLSDWPVGTALSTVTGGAQQKIIEAHLHWSDYYQGQWSEKQSGGFDNPISVQVPVSYTSSQFDIIVTKESNIADSLDGALHISLSGLNKAFRLVNKNSPPEIIPSESFPAWKFTSNYYYINRLKVDRGNLAVSYPHSVTTLNGTVQNLQSDPQTILGKIPGDFNLVPCSAPVTMGGAEFGPLITPFFYQDNWYTFYVEPTLSETQTINEWDEWVGGPSVVYEPPKIDWSNIPIQPYYPWPKNVPVPKVGDPGHIDLDDGRIKVPPQTRQDWATNPSVYIKYDQRVIGKDTGMNVFLNNANGNAPVLVKESDQLNSVLHGSGSLSSVFLVPTSGGVKLSDPGLTNTVTANSPVLTNTGITNTGIANTGILNTGSTSTVVVNTGITTIAGPSSGTVLVGGGGIFGIQKNIPTLHMGGIFAGKTIQR